MKNKFLKTTKDFKGKVLIEELKRAHIIIALLSLSLLALLDVSASTFMLSTWLIVVANVLLLIVALISILIALKLSKK